MKRYLKLIRPYGMLYLGFAPVFGAIANGEFNLTHLLPLFIIGSLAHIFTFVQNDYYDIEIDRKSKYVSNRPLVTGSISRKTTIAIFVTSFILSSLLAIVFFFTFHSFTALLLSFLCMTIYNKYSKRFFGMEYILGMGVFSYGIFGAYTISNNISLYAFLISTVGCMQWVFSVGISANLKDVEFDKKQGIQTTPSVFGVHVSDNKLMIPHSFIVYAFIIKLTHILIGCLPFFLGYSSLYLFNLPIPGVCFLIISLMLLYLTQKILSTSLKERDTMLIYIGLQEGLSLLLLPTLLMSYLTENISIQSVFLMIILFISWPLFWFRTLFGKRMIPLE